jgi:glycine betaine catabolism B
MMGATFAVIWNRVFAVLGRVSMYRLTFLALIALAVISLALSFFGLVSPGPLELIASLAVLAVVAVLVDSVAQYVMKLPYRVESSLITALILLFVLRPTLDPLGLAGLAIGALAASLSKYVLAWRGRHVFNPAAVGATVLTLLAIAFPALGASSWWVGSPVMLGPVLVLGIIVLWRTEKARMVLVFWVVALATVFVRMSVQFQAAGSMVTWPDVLTAYTFSPAFFLGAFMLSEPLTQPPRRWQQFTVAIVVGVLVGWPILIGPISLGQERALLIGNLVAFAFALRTAVKAVLVSRDAITPTVRQLTFTASRSLKFVPGQYLELDVPHRRPDGRGTRREFSIVSAPHELPTVRIAFREGDAGTKPLSSYKRALADVQPGDGLAVTGVWGDFVLPRRTAAPVLLVAAGIGVTPFVSQLREDALTGAGRDAVLIYVASQASELAFRDELAATGVPVIVFTRDRPADLPAHWRWAGGTRLDAEGLRDVVPDLGSRHAYISGPPALLADLAPALASARSVTTDAFAGY